MLACVIVARIVPMIVVVVIVPRHAPIVVPPPRRMTHPWVERPWVGNFFGREGEYAAESPKKMMPYADVPSPPQPTDAALVAASLAGDERAFATLYRRHGATVYRFAYLWSGTAGVASDVAQETFIHLHMRGGDFDAARGELRPWLLGIARNLVRRQLSARHQETPTDFAAADALLPEACATDPDPRSDPLAALLGDEANRELHRLIRRLPTAFRDALVLVDLQENSYADAAAICGCEIGTIRSRLSRARALLGEALNAKARA
jgi:RNA polymerase sigma-70 factor (ECF subfamily)